MMLPRALLADDHAMIVDALRALLEPHVAVVGTYGDGAQLLEAASRLQPDIVVTDVSMPRMTGIEFLHEAKSRGIRSRVIVLSMYADEELIRTALRAGARGYLPKHAAGDELITAIREVMQGRRYLSPLVGERSHAIGPLRGGKPPRRITQRQREVMQLVAAGKRMKEIAAQLDLSRRTVEMHKYKLMRALGVRTTAELIQYFVKHEAITEIGPAITSE